MDLYLSADNIIDKWKTDRENIYDNIVNNKIFNIWSNISDSNNCSCDSNCNTNLLSNVCQGCKLTSRLFKSNIIIPNSDFKINIGKYINCEFCFKKVTVDNSKLEKYEKDVFSVKYGKKIIEQIQLMSSCENNFTTLINSTNFFVSKGSFIEHYFVMSCILEQYLKGLPTIPVIKWLYQCNNSINCIEEKINTININEISSLDILLQLIPTLKILSEKFFTHGSPTINSLIFEKKPCSFNYLGKNITSTFSLRFLPSCYSSINVSNNRLFFNNSILSYKFYDMDSFPQIFIKQRLSLDIDSIYNCTYSNQLIPCLPTYNKIYKTCYKIGKDYELFYSYVSNYGLPLFYSSFDLYCFLISLLIQPSFFYDFMSNLKLELIWKELWNTDEYTLVMTSLSLLNPKSTYFEILKFLSNFDLRCDGINFFWENLQKVLV